MEVQRYHILNACSNVIKRNNVRFLTGDCHTTYTVVSLWQEQELESVQPEVVTSALSTYLLPHFHFLKNLKWEEVGNN